MRVRQGVPLMAAGGILAAEDSWSKKRAVARLFHPTVATPSFSLGLHHVPAPPLAPESFTLPAQR
jgi:hypothetical protein